MTALGESGCRSRKLRSHAVMPGYGNKDGTGTTGHGSAARILKLEFFIGEQKDDARCLQGLP